MVFLNVFSFDVTLGSCPIITALLTVNLIPSDWFGSGFSRILAGSFFISSLRPSWSVVMFCISEKFLIGAVLPVLGWLADKVESCYIELFFYSFSLPSAAAGGFSKTTAALWILFLFLLFSALILSLVFSSWSFWSLNLWMMWALGLSSTHLLTIESLSNGSDWTESTRSFCFFISLAFTWFLMLVRTESFWSKIYVYNLRKPNPDFADACFTTPRLLELTPFFDGLLLFFSELFCFLTSRFDQPLTEPFSLSVRISSDSGSFLLKFLSLCGPCMSKSAVTGSESPTHASCGNLSRPLIVPSRVYS